MLFLHHELGGTYLLSQRLRTRVDLGALLERHTAKQPGQRLLEPCGRL